MAFWATCKIAQQIQPIWQHIFALPWSALKKPPWEFNFFHIFGIPPSSRHEKWCQMLQTLFWLFQCSKNPRWHRWKSSGKTFSSYYNNHWHKNSMKILFWIFVWPLHLNQFTRNLLLRISKKWLRFDIKKDKCLLTHFWLKIDEKVQWQFTNKAANLWRLDSVVESQYKYERIWIVSK